MDRKIKILFHTTDSAGVNYYRMLTPAMELERNYSDLFEVEINQEINFSDPNILDYLKKFDIIHYHRQLFPMDNNTVLFFNELKNSGVKLVMDIDDYWELHKDHPLFFLHKEKNLTTPIITNLKLADYITTTTDLFAEEIKKVTGKDNVCVLYNSVNPDWMKQFQNNWKPDENGKVRIIYVAGSSHMVDVEQLRGVINVLYGDIELRDKFKIIIAGWDAQGGITDVHFNKEFGNELHKLGLWNQKMVNLINKTRGNVDLIPEIPNVIKDKYRNNVFSEKSRDILSKESIYFEYEKILTDNHNIIKSKDYYDWLMNLERNHKYENEDNYGRRWTQKANVYANVLNEADIVLSPLAYNKFNTFKSNLKQVEVWSRKLPIICSDMPPYNVDGKHLENCILIPTEKNARKYWQKYLKKLILNEDFRKELGENLYRDFSIKYHLTNVTK